MSLIKLIVAVIVLVGLGGLIYWVNKNPQDKTAATPAAPKLLDVPDSSVQSIQLLKRDQPPLVLAKDKGKWSITAPAAFSADQDAVISMVSSLSGVNADSIVDDNPAEVGKYGLKDPPLTVAVKEKSGKTDQIFFGDDVPAGSLVYVRVGKDPKVYAASTSLRSSFSKDVKDLRDKRLLTFDPAQVSRLELISPKSDTEFGKVNQSDWQILKPEVYRADSFQVDDLLRKLADAKMDLSGKPEETKAADKAFNSGRVVATAKVTDQSGVQSLDVRQSNEDFYAHSSVVAGSFKLSVDLGKILDKPSDEFRNKKLFDFGFSDITRLELHQGAGDKVYTRSGTDWKLNNKTMDPGSVQAVVDKLRDLSATAFVTTGFKNADVSITVVSNDGKRTEKAEFSKVAEGYIARREGQPALYKLEVKPVNDILEAAAAVKAAVPNTKK